MPTLVERLRSGYEALSRDGDFSAIFDEFDPEVALHQDAEGPERLVMHRGHEGLVRWREGMAGAWEEVNYELLECLGGAHGARRWGSRRLPARVASGGRAGGARGRP
jgi:hypothetical protein